MSFVGIVTQKDKPTGVSLMAKVVTANKKKWAKKVFKVSVKANGLDDFTCCVLDHATAVDKVTSAQDVNSIIDDLVLTYSGINNTSITYRIINVSEPHLSTYLAEDGTVIGRPKYGEGDASGYIEITVSKNDASVTSRIQASVKSIGAEEVLSSATFTQAALWSLIKGNNDSYQQSSVWSGHNNIANTLTLIKTKEVPNLSIKPVNITWTVVDNTLPYASALYTEPRIDVATGAIYRPSYKDACTLVNSVSTLNVSVVGSDNTSTQNRVRIGGITLKAILTLDTTTKTVAFECSTISKYITNQEVMDVVLANLYLTAPNGSRISYIESNASGVATTIVAPAAGGQYTLKAFGNTGSETFEAPELKLGVGDITNVIITNSVLDYEGSNDYANTSLLVTAFNNGFQNDDGDTYSKLVIDMDALKDASEADKKFACGAYITVSGYSATGDTASSGAGLNIKRHAQFVVNTDAITSATTEPEVG